MSTPETLKDSFKDAGMCPHGNFSGSCEQCHLESQPSHNEGSELEVRISKNHLQQRVNEALELDSHEAREFRDQLFQQLKFAIRDEQAKWAGQKALTPEEMEAIDKFELGYDYDDETGIVHLKAELRASAANQVYRLGYTYETEGEERENEEDPVKDTIFRAGKQISVEGQEQYLEKCFEVWNMNIDLSLTSMQEELEGLKNGSYGAPEKVRQHLDDDRQEKWIARRIFTLNDEIERIDTLKQAFLKAKEEYLPRQ